MVKLEFQFHFINFVSVLTNCERNDFLPLTRRVEKLLWVWYWFIRVIFLFQIVSNSEVWDMRTFHLLRTVPALNQCTVRFSGINNVIYASVLEQELDDEDLKYDTSFKTLDAIDYSSIGKLQINSSTLKKFFVWKYSTCVGITVASTLCCFKLVNLTIVWM